jgi:hypothetical protein
MLGGAHEASGMTNGWTVSPPPWTAVLMVNGQEDCSGAVVADGWALFAAHCFDANFPLSSMTVGVGRSSTTSADGAVYSLARTPIKHPNYKVKVQDDVALVQLAGFDSNRWHALPLALDQSSADSARGVTVFGYGNTGWSITGKQVGAGPLHKSPDGAFVRDPTTDYPGLIGFRGTTSTRLLQGDSGAPIVKWVAGSWNLVAVWAYANAFSQSEPGNPYHGTSIFALNGPATVRDWIRSTAHIPSEPVSSILQSSQGAWLLLADGYRHWIPTMGDLQCFRARGYQVVALSQPTIDTFPDAVGSHATCTSPSPPPPPATVPETAGQYGSGTFTNYTNAGGTIGQRIAAYQTVQIACRLQGFKVADGNTWWYRVASSPWNNTFYTPADNFYNNGQTSGSLAGTPWVDLNVPSC